MDACYGNIADSYPLLAIHHHIRLDLVGFKVKSDWIEDCEAFSCYFYKFFNIRTVEYFSKIALHVAGNCVVSS